MSLRRRAAASVLAVLLYIFGMAYALIPLFEAILLGSETWIGHLYLVVGIYGLAAAALYLTRPRLSLSEKRRKSRRKTRVVAIDDEEDILRLLRIKLSREGFRVMTASNGNEGILTVLDKNPDIMLVDVMMPGKDGYEVVSEIKQRLGEEAPVIIMLTSRSKKEDILTGLSVGADDYITKPFSPTELIERINVALLKQQAARMPMKD